MPSREQLEAASESMAFFPHDSNASQDEKCQRLIFRRGYEGYGRWWRIAEYLAHIRGHRIPFQTDEDALILATVLGFRSGGAFDDRIAIDDCQSFVRDLIDIGLLEADGDGNLINNRMFKNSLYFGAQKANGRKGGRARKKQAAEDSAGKEA